MDNQGWRTSGVALIDPAILRWFRSDQSLWHETPEEITAGLEWGRRKAELLSWVRRQIKTRLTRRERRCMELYFFEHLNYRQVGHVTDSHASSVFRAVQRSLRKLRQAAAEEHITLLQRRRRRPG
jgi:DNA-directed RNA polymerase specialized sigma subunit